MATDDEAHENSNSTTKTTTKTNVNSSKKRSSRLTKKEKKKKKAKVEFEAKTDHENPTTKKKNSMWSEEEIAMLKAFSARIHQGRVDALSNTQLCRQYDKQIRRSGGFDVADGRFGFMGIRYEGFDDMGKLQGKDYDMVCRYSKAGIDQYNRDNNTNYQFVEFVKAVQKLASGYKYYLTFEAKEPSDDAPTTFQALVKRGFPNTFRDGTENVLVLLVRKKSCATKRDNDLLIG